MKKRHERLRKGKSVVIEFRLGNGRSNDSGDSSKGIPRGGSSGDGKSPSNSGKNIKQWKAGRGSV